MCDDEEGREIMRFKPIDNTIEKSKEIYNKERQLNKHFSKNEEKSE